MLFRVLGEEKVASKREHTERCPDKERTWNRGYCMDRSGMEVPVIELYRTPSTRQLLHKMQLWTSPDLWLQEMIKTFEMHPETVRQFGRGLGWLKWLLRLAPAHAVAVSAGTKIPLLKRNG
ncbi:MAG: hypothetical protein WA477_08770 [Candidatus Sulfotelmatobacter sp.]